MLWSILLDPTRTDKSISSFNKAKPDVSKSNSITKESAHMRGSLSTRSWDTFMCHVLYTFQMNGHKKLYLLETRNC